MYLIATTTPRPDRTRADGFPLLRTVTIAGTARTVVCAALETTMLRIEDAQLRIATVAARLGLFPADLTPVELPAYAADPPRLHGAKAYAQVVESIMGNEDSPAPGTPRHEIATLAAPYLVTLRARFGPPAATTRTEAPTSGKERQAFFRALSLVLREILDVVEAP